MPSDIPTDPIFLEGIFGILLSSARQGNLRNLGHMVMDSKLSTTLHCLGNHFFLVVIFYNNLSQNAMDAASVTLFQNMLIDIVRGRCQNGDVSWDNSFCARGDSDLHGPCVPT